MSVAMLYSPEAAHLRQNRFGSQGRALGLHDIFPELSSARRHLFRRAAKLRTLAGSPALSRSFASEFVEARFKPLLSYGREDAVFATCILCFRWSRHLAENMYD
jgi:hypothetical protein